MKTRYRNVAFLAELMINILVFSISCAVLVGLFGKAAQLSRQTKEETAASTEALALLETVKADGTCQRGAWQEDGTLLCRYDGDWSPTESEVDTAYEITLTVAPAATAGGEVWEMVAQATDAAGRVLCRLETANYRPDFAAQLPVQGVATGESPA